MMNVHSVDTIWEYYGLKARVCTSMHKYVCNFMAKAQLVDNVDILH
jgi:hypothetical protein